MDRVHSRSNKLQGQGAPRNRFQLKGHTPPVRKGAAGGKALAMGVSKPRAKGAVASASALVKARAAMGVRAEESAKARSEGLSSQEEKAQARALDLLHKALLTKPNHSASSEEPRRQVSATALEGLASTSARIGVSASADAPRPSGSASAPPSSHVLSLVHRIEELWRSHRPALKLRLDSLAFAEVEIERSGPQSVSIQIRGRRRPTAQELRQIRVELQARGLRIRKLSVSALSPTTPKAE